MLSVGKETSKVNWTAVAKESSVKEESGLQHLLMRLEFSQKHSRMSIAQISGLPERKSPPRTEGRLIPRRHESHSGST